MDIFTAENFKGFGDRGLRRYRAETFQRDHDVVNSREWPARMWNFLNFIQCNQARELTFFGDQKTPASRAQEEFVNKGLQVRVAIYLSAVARH